MNVILYSKNSCDFCVRAKSLLKMKNIHFQEMVVGTDILTEDFKATFPNQKTVPLIIIDGQKIGGYTQLVEYFNNSPTFLTEGNS